MVSDNERRELFSAAERQWGSGPAATLMELLPPVGWADVARQSDLVAVRGEMAHLRGEVAGLRGEMAELRGELKGEMAELRAELKGEMAELRCEYHALLPRLITANIASMVGFCALILAVASFVK
jgi:hypothetical protein